MSTNLDQQDIDLMYDQDLEMTEAAWICVPLLLKHIYIANTNYNEWQLNWDVVY